MQGYDGERQIVTRTVPTGGVVADSGYVIGDEFLVAMSTAAEATTAEFVRVGVCKFVPKTTGQTNTRGTKAYFNPTTGKTENASSATNYLIGTFDAAAESADIYSSVLLVGAPVAVGGTPTEHEHAADEVTYTNDAVPALADVEGALDTIIDYIRQLPVKKTITVALGASTGTSAGDTSMIGGAVQSIVPVSGVDNFPIACDIHETTGVITLTLEDVSTAEAVYDVWVKPVLPA